MNGRGIGRGSGRGRARWKSRERGREWDREREGEILWIHVLHESAAQLGIGVLPSLTLVRGPFRSVVAHMFSNCPMVGNYPKASIR